MKWGLEVLRGPLPAPPGSCPGSISPRAWTHRAYTASSSLHSGLAHSPSKCGEGAVRGPDICEINLEAVASTGSSRMSQLVGRGATALTALGCRRGHSPFHFQTTDTSVILVSVQTRPSEAFSPICWSLFFMESQSSPPSLLHPGSGLCGELLLLLLFFLLRMHKKEHFFICDLSGRVGRWWPWVRWLLSSSLMETQAPPPMSNCLVVTV